VVLYNGGAEPGLLKPNLAWAELGAVVHPSPRRLHWGRLHEFALDCMRFSLESLPFDTLTIVDSDQLAVRPGYSAFLEQHLSGRRAVGLLGNQAQIQPRGTEVGPARAAHAEIELWRPFLRRFTGGEAKFVHWSFWPSTVFTADAARDLTRLFAADRELGDILRRSRIWASEEVILPTLVALLGFDVATNPCSYDYVKYRQVYTTRQAESALSAAHVFWMHPVNRSFNDPVRRHIRGALGEYRPECAAEPTEPPDHGSPRHGPPLLTLPILAAMRRVEGWLDDAEADLLIGASAQVLRELPSAHALVEVGSHCGRSTVVLGKVAQAVRPEARVYAIDPHDGRLGALDGSLIQRHPSLASFRRNIAAAGVSEVVVSIQSRSEDVSWTEPIALLLIDGLHDYTSAARDFHHFERHVVIGGYVLFHDHADYFPGVQAVSAEAIASGAYRRVSLQGSLLLLQKTGDTARRAEAPGTPGRAHAQRPGPRSTPAAPLVSCLMVTRDRRSFVTQSIKYYQQQDHPDRELIVIDDGQDGIGDLVRSDPTIRYVRLDRRLSVGAKRNLGCELAKGDFIAHWDDDDWMSRHRLSYQLRSLQQGQVDVCGVDRPLFSTVRLDRAWQYVYPGGSRRWLSGASLLYRKEAWRNTPFPDVDVGEDALFLWSMTSQRLLTLPDNTFHIAFIHAGNVSPKRVTDPWWRVYAMSEIKRLIGEDQDFYLNTFH
jgi:hypothetical protein